jgi:hypothetical protein
VARARIEANLAACKLALGRLETLHARVPDETDVEPLGYDRAAAVWLAAGRCLGLLGAFLVQIEAGVCGEAIPTYRAIHEADQLLRALCDDQEDDLLRKCLSRSTSPIGWHGAPGGEPRKRSWGMSRRA